MTTRLTSDAREPYVVDIKHWRYERVTAGDVIDRWTITYDGANVITRDTELEARMAAKAHGWTVARVYEAQP